jgi:AcrR family transcriptional regulator
MAKKGVNGASMSAEVENDTLPRGKPRVVKAAAVRRAELIDCAQRLFLEKGYERTTINDVIAATGLSKGAFYHHFSAKEDLLEAIAERVGQAALAASRTPAGAELNALGRLNYVLAMGREWKLDHLHELRAMFTVLLKPENSVLYHRIVGALFIALSPAVIAIVEQGVREGVFAPVDAKVAAETLLGLAEGRRAVVLDALVATELGDIDDALDLIVSRVRAEEAIVDRILGLPPGSVAFMGAAEELRLMLEAWRTAPR